MNEPREALEDELSDLAGLLQTDESLDAMLRHVADIAVRAIPACDAAGPTPGRPRRLRRSGVPDLAARP